MRRTDTVITGLGVIGPTGCGTGGLAAALRDCRSGISPLPDAWRDALGVHLAGRVLDFEPKKLVRPRKSLKLLSRDMQLAVAAALAATEDAGLRPGDCDPLRVGVVLGADRICTPVEECAPSYAACLDEAGRFAMCRWGTRGYANINPLGMLKTLPNLVACHVAIALNAQGHNNTQHAGEVSGLLAVGEAVRVIERGWADVVLAGGSSSLMDPFDWARSLRIDELSRTNGDGTAPRPFDARRDGQVRGEGAAVLVVESRRHAEARGAEVRARVLGSGAACGGRARGAAAVERGLAGAMAAALANAGLAPRDVGHLNAHGLGTREGDRLEAAAIGQLFNGVPVTAPKSYFGNLAAASGAVEAAVSVLALQRAEVPATLHYACADRDCPLLVVHDEPLTGAAAVALAINHTPQGQAAALLLGGA